MATDTSTQQSSTGELSPIERYCLAIHVLFDCLRNEEDVGKAVRKSGTPREEIFVTTKVIILITATYLVSTIQLQVWNTSHGKEKTAKSLKESLRL